MVINAILALLATAALFDIWRNIHYYMHKNDPDPDELIACFEKNMITSFSETDIVDCKLKKNVTGFNIILATKNGKIFKSVYPIKYHWFKGFKKNDKVHLVVTGDIVIFKAMDVCTVLSFEDRDFVKGDFV